MKHVENQDFKTPPHFGDYLVERGYISSTVLRDAHLESERLNCSLDRSLIAADVVTRDVLSKANARFLDVEFINIKASPPDARLSDLFDPAMLVRYCVVPWKKTGSTIVLVCESPEAYLSFVSQLEIAGEN